MPFFLHELAIPEFVYDGKTLAKRTIAKMLRKSTVSELPIGSVYNLSPKNCDDAFVAELVIFDPSRAVMRLRKRYPEQIANAYSVSPARRIRYIDEPEMHVLGDFEGARTFFPIIDDTQPDLSIRQVISYSESVPEVPIRRLRDYKGRAQFV